MSKIPIVFTFDKNHLLPASIAIDSLLETKNNNTEYDIYILYDGSINEEEIEKFSKYGKINWIKVIEDRLLNVPKNDYWSELVYYRILIPELFPKHDKIIYSDVDVLFKTDLSEVFEQNIDNYYWAGVIAEQNNQNAVCHKYFPENKNEFIYMSGFMLINCKKMREDNIVDKIFQNINIFNNRLRFFDLDLLNITCNKIASIPFEYCVLENIYNSINVKSAKEYPWLINTYTKEELEHAKAHPAIIHYAGENPKIWKRSFNKIPSYYWNYIQKSPFYNKEFYFQSKKKNILKTIIYWILEHICPSKKIRRKIRQIRKELN